MDASFTDQAKTLIELAHRVKSGLFGILIIGLYIWARKIFPRGHHCRNSAFMALLLTITEALLGAKLVLLGLVADNSSALRAVSMSLHLGNTLLLLFALTACWESKNSFRLKRFPWPQKGMWICIAALFTIAISGSWAALASTLFPSTSLLAGIKADFNNASHWLIRIRVLHPILALSLSLLSLYLIQTAKEKCSDSAIKKLGGFVQIFICSLILIGMSTLLSGAPTIMKLLHLLSADLVWIIIIIYSMRLTTQTVEK